MTLFDLAHQVTSVLDQDELFQKISELLARVIPYDAFAVYLLDKKRNELRIAYPSGYPPGVAETVRLKVGEGVVGTAIAEQRPMVFNDVQSDPRYKNYVPGMNSALVVPLIYQTQVIGALNILSHQRDTFDESDIPLLRQFAAHVAVALENSRLFERERENSDGVRNARGDRPAARGDSRSRRAAHAHGAVDQAGDRLPHVRHLAAQREDVRRWNSRSPCTTARPCRRRG